MTSMRIGVALSVIRRPIDVDPSRVRVDAIDVLGDPRNESLDPGGATHPQDRMRTALDELDHHSQRPALAVDDGYADQVRLVVLVFRQRRQLRARYANIGA